MTEATEARPVHPLRDKILNSQDLKREPIELAKWWPELGGVKLFVQSMSAADRSRYEASMDFDAAGNARDRHNIQAKLAVRVLIDEDGNRIFGDDDLDAISAKNSGAIQHIFNVGADLNGLTLKALREQEKNLRSAPTAT